ncbi:21289_t:CDS:2, partial [Entrophospora sp. SA101]
KAKKILDESGKKYQVLELDEIGCDDLVAVKNNGTLETLLLAAPS